MHFDQPIRLNADVDVGRRHVSLPENAGSKAGPFGTVTAGEGEGDGEGDFEVGFGAQSLLSLLQPSLVTSLPQTARTLLSVIASNSQVHSALLSSSPNTGAVGIVRINSLELRAPHSLALPLVLPLPISSTAFTLISWSLDGLLVAVAAQDGSIRIASLSGDPVALIESTFDDNDSVAAVNPFAAIVFVPHLNADDPSAYCILAVSYTGGLRMFYFNYIPSTSSVSLHPANFWRQTPHRINSRAPVAAIYIGDIVPLVGDVKLIANDRLLVSGLNGNKEPVVHIFRLHLNVPPFLSACSPGIPTPLDVTAEISNLIQPQTSSMWENMADLLADLYVHAFESTKESISMPLKRMCTKTSISPNQSQVLTLALDGGVTVWNVRGEIPTITCQHTPSEIDAYRKSLDSINAHNGSLARLVGVEWWSESTVVFLFSDGLFLITTLPLSPQSQPLYTSYFNAPTISVWASKQIYILEKSSLSPPKGPRSSELLSRYLLDPPTQSLSGLSHVLDVFANIKLTESEVLSTVIHHSTSQQSVDLRLALGDYETAQQLCSIYKLDSDIIYKDMFLYSDGGIKLLNSIHDTSWVMDACFYFSPKDNARSVREKLMAVLDRTERVSLSAVEEEVEEILLGEETSDQINRPVSNLDLVLYRVKAIKYLDRLDTFEAIQETGVIPFKKPFKKRKVDDESIFSDIFMLFCETNLVLVASWHASKANIKALEILFAKHSAELVPYRFMITSHIPVAMDLEKVQNILPKCSLAGDREAVWWPSPRPWRRKLDWTEVNSSIEEFLREFTQIDEKDQSPFSSKWKPMPISPVDGAIVTAWYLEKAFEIEDDFCDTEMALTFLSAASGDGYFVKGLEASISELRALNDLLQEDDVGSLGMLSLADLKRMPVDEIIDTLLEPVINQPDLFCHRIKKVVVPILKRAEETGSTSLSDSVLDSYIRDLASRQSETCIRVFETQALHRDCLSLAGMILNCAYAVQASDSSFVILTRFLKCIPSISSISTTVRLDTTPSSNGWDNDFEDESHEDLPAVIDSRAIDLCARIDLFEARLEAIELLQKYGIFVSLEYLSSPEFQAVGVKSLMAVKMARYYAADEVQQQGGFSDEKWKTLGIDLTCLLDLRIFADVNRNPVIKEFLKVILHEGRFSLAKQLIESNNNAPLIDPVAIEELVLECAKELYDNADVSDSSQVDLKLAAECLKVVPATAKIQVEQCLIDATHQILKVCSALSVPAPLPLQIRLNSNRMDIISSLVYSTNSPKSIDMKLLLDIGRKLNGIDSLSAQQKKVDMAVRGIVANWALDRNDPKYAVKICEEMMEAILSDQRSFKREFTKLCRSDESWLICVRLLRQVGEELDPVFRSRLVGFILEHSESGSMLEILDLIRATKIGHSLGHGSDLISLNYSDCLDFVYGMLVELPSSESSKVVNSGHQLSTHDFYGGCAMQNGCSAYMFQTSVQIPTEKRSLSELYVNINHVLTCKRIFERRRGVELVDQSDSLLNYFLTLAQEHYRSGEIESALLILLDIKDDSLVRDFFDSLEPTRSHDMLAMYFFSLRTFLQLVPTMDQPKLLPKLINLPPIPLLQSMDSAFIRDAAFSAGENSCPFRSLQAAASFSSRTKSSKNGQVASRIIAEANADEIEFNSNEVYRKDVILTLARGFNESRILNDVFTVVDSFGVSPSLLALEHICWLFTAKNVPTETLNAALSEFGSLVTDDDVSQLHHLKLNVVATNDDPRIALYYSYLAHRHADNETLASQLRSRNSLIQALAMSQSRIFGAVTLEKIIASNYFEVEVLAEYYSSLLRKNISLSSFQELVDLIPSLRKLVYLDIFSDEVTHLQSQTPSASTCESLYSVLCETLVDMKLKSVDFEYQDEEIILSDFDELCVLVEYASSNSIRKILASYVIGDESIFAPIEQRLRLVIRCIEILPSNSIMSHELQDILRHLQLIEELYRHNDIMGSERIPLERVQQFDSSFGDGIDANVILCMKMVIAGSSPSLIFQTCQLLTARFDTVLDFSANQIYTDTILAIVGVPRLEFHEKAFRNDVENAGDALARLFQSTFSNLPSTDRQLKSSGFDENGWDEDDIEFLDANYEKVDSLEGFLNTLRESLHAVIVDVIYHRRDVVPPDVRLSVISLMKLHFGPGDIEEPQIQTARIESVAKNVWNLEISESDTTDVKLFMTLFDKLLSLSSTEAHCDGLLQIMESLSPEFLPEKILTKYAHEMILKAAESKSYTLLMQLRLSVKYGPFDEITESEVLEVLKAQNTPTSTLEWIKHSLMSSEDRIALLCKAPLLRISSLSFGKMDPFLHLLILGNSYSCDVVTTELWPNIVMTLSSKIASPQHLVDSYEFLLNITIIDLIVGGYSLAAFDLVLNVFKIRKDVLGSDGTVEFVLKGFLRRVGTGVTAVGVLNKDEITSTDGFDGIMECDFVRKLKEVSSLRVKGESEGTRVLAALAALNH
ncbi:hypothetical protein BCR33DRAFT_711998 [Rhizoclosmatium globosum]|uniref:Sec39 domain-containing protein n=1 Tax=Rhizoclosmatium globosum TaxID=329046 RepID=A0A1Y2CXP8_9FUNG|nr:hypothetical protein BCR33DRAFT_711998 [Rhizoclosmatium globosum]|eukprot:ORY51800.1 hypothetical protein BCR33DRAFT_711998 [Rhizoclosmatium globosum]